VRLILCLNRLFCPSVLWRFWLGYIACKNWPYCVGWDITQSLICVSWPSVSWFWPYAGITWLSPICISIAVISCPVWTWRIATVTVQEVFLFIAMLALKFWCRVRCRFSLGSHCHICSCVKLNLCSWRCVNAISSVLQWGNDYNKNRTIYKVLFVDINLITKLNF